MNYHDMAFCRVVPLSGLKTQQTTEVPVDNKKPKRERNANLCS